MKQNHQLRNQLVRLDAFLAKFKNITRSRAQLLIRQGCVTVNGKLVTKAGTLVDSSDDQIAVLQDFAYVSFSGNKLKKALDHFGCDVADKVCLDAGLSTGGFTDCLLQQGAKKVYGVDVGTAQVDRELAADTRLVVMESTDIRNVILPEKVDLITLDLSFISLTKIIPSLLQHLRPGAHCLLLVKPQFELDKDSLNAQGGVKNQKLIDQALQNVQQALAAHGLQVLGICDVPKKEEAANQECMIYAYFPGS